MAVYLKRFRLPDRIEDSVLPEYNTTWHNTVYPYHVFDGRIPELVFDPATVIYGGNGSGKTTVLNVIAEKLKLRRGAPFNRSTFFERYLEDCHAVLGIDDDGDEFDLSGGKFIASDDVFQHILNVRDRNSQIDRDRVQDIRKYFDARSETGFRYDSGRKGDYEKLTLRQKSKSHTLSEFIRRETGGNIPERSNGESAFNFFTAEVGENTRYLLDEPENSLSPALQLELVYFLEMSLRLGNQFIIATHSPLILSVVGAKIYDIDRDPAQVRPWHDLENPRIYYEFFKKYAEFFEE